jgi:hypothetical protein
LLRLEAISSASHLSILDSSDARFVTIGAMPIPVELGPVAQVAQEAAWR